MHGCKLVTKGLRRALCVGPGLSSSLMSWKRSWRRKLVPLICLRGADEGAILRTPPPALLPALKSACPHLSTRE